MNIFCLPLSLLPFAVTLHLSSVRDCLAWECLRLDYIISDKHKIVQSFLQHVGYVRVSRKASICPGLQTKWHTRQLYFFASYKQTIVNRWTSGMPTQVRSMQTFMD